ncbi:MAG: arsenate reductase ArsC [Desulfurivibrionaceae bacterium]|jgi:arsenate reductase|nr:arsenate reductase ArsC [Pseudomonadota bacterium]MCG2822565.1 arsenate reductase ArsC [Desulfobulbaceae bacterium]MDP2002633.1 arsenate reductase ArsC [Desulfurivibrionaceae bacterium]PKN21739.1 MAG: arsenate reductase [Deltaproteobacteria bacterium HGW-Deltaproteobacteria-3]
MHKQKILFLCTGNSCRSQMAEGWGRHFHPDRYEFYSAGIEKHGINPLAVKVMAEAGVDIGTQYSKLLSELEPAIFDYVITVCDHANEQCPFFPGKAIKLHQEFPDPPRLARTAASEEEALGHYRAVRDAIREYLINLPSILASMHP